MVYEKATSPRYGVVFAENGERVTAPGTSYRQACVAAHDWNRCHEGVRRVAVAEVYYCFPLPAYSPKRAGSFKPSWMGGPVIEASRQPAVRPLRHRNTYKPLEPTVEWVTDVRL